MESALIFLGTGSSGSVPCMRCLIDPSDPPCPVCAYSLSFPPHLNPNYRCNSSLLIDYYCRSDATHKYILIDAGKTFRETALRWFVFHHIPRVDSLQIVLTHEHADAVLGLDDVLAVQPFSPTNDIDPIPVYLTQHSMDSVEKRFPYLVQKKHKEGQEMRRVALLCWNIIADDCNRPFFASGLKLIPLPVMHGEDYICLGFLFGEKNRVAYISDVSRIPASTECVISKSGAGQAGQLDLLILDALEKTGSPNVHFCLPQVSSAFFKMMFTLFIYVPDGEISLFVISQTLETVKRLCPKQTLLIGMNHKFDHHKDNEFLMEWSRREGLSVQLAHDGLRVPINL
ncbi:putative hydrolase C777.06c isoform X1 [Glycine max]|uniref:putative hydrolase C777.06c isoform X1 n=1 Tax=Glycine max TaxID=3847 RepID=UPI0007191F14|nr:putative hydrolase C777.06c isoform X1 [Glycine max]|eukprot:XP_014634312.1 putative hydrolase C777.06c isoform X3 [Glycine max]